MNRAIAWVDPYHYAYQLIIMIGRAYFIGFT